MLNVKLFFSACYLNEAGFFLDIFFDAEDGGEIFFRNVGWFSMD
jgi:hypothetical protein